MVSRSDIIVPVRLDALNGVIRVEAELIKHLFVQSIIERHDLFGWEQAFRLLFLELPIPWVRSDFFNAVSVRWVNLQDFGNKVAAIG